MRTGRLAVAAALIVLLGAACTPAGSDASTARPHRQAGRCDRRRPRRAPQDPGRGGERAVRRVSTSKRPEGFADVAAKTPLAGRHAVSRRERDQDLRRRRRAPTRRAAPGRAGSTDRPLPLPRHERAADPRRIRAGHDHRPRAPEPHLRPLRLRREHRVRHVEHAPTPVTTGRRASSCSSRWTTAGPSPRPGRRYHYADTNYVLLGEILERATGHPLAAAVRDEVGFDRLGLDQTYWESFETAPPGQAPRAAPVLRPELRQHQARRVGRPVRRRWSHLDRRRPHALLPRTVRRQGLCELRDAGRDVDRSPSRPATRVPASGSSRRRSPGSGAGVIPATGARRRTPARSPRWLSRWRRTRPTKTTSTPPPWNARSLRSRTVASGASGG